MEKTDGVSGNPNTEICVVVVSCDIVMYSLCSCMMLCCSCVQLALKYFHVSNPDFWVQPVSFAFVLTLGVTSVRGFILNLIKVCVACAPCYFVVYTFVVEGMCSSNAHMRMRALEGLACHACQSSYHS